MSAHIYITFGVRTVMVAKPATYQDLKREIRTHFPMLGSVSSMVVLWKDNGNATGNWIEVVDSAYSVIPSGAELFVNVAEPITKRYIFPLPDGRNSNVGPLKQVPMGGGLSMRNNNIGQQVSINNKPKTSRYKYPGSGSSFKFDRSVGAACASGWAVASERYRRSAKLVPDLEDCKGAVGLEVGESNCYPDEDGKSADNMSGHVQHQHYDACSRACNHECDCELCLQELDEATVHHTDSAPGHAAGQNGEATAYSTSGKSFRQYYYDSHWGPSPDHVRPSGHVTSPTPDLDPYEGSPRGWADMPSPHTVTRHRNPAWGVDDYRQKRKTGSCSSHDDYILDRRDDSPGWPYPWRSRAGGGGRSGAHEKEEYADRQYAQAAMPWNNDHVQSASDTVPTSNHVQDSDQTALDMAYYRDAQNACLPQATNQTGPAMADHDPVQVSHDVRRRTRDYEVMDWSPPSRKPSGCHRPKQQQPQADSHRSPPYYHPPPPRDHFTRANPARVSTGSPIARTRRSHLPHWTTTEQKRDKRANAVDQQARNQGIENGMQNQTLLDRTAYLSSRGPAHHTPMSVYAQRLGDGDAGFDDDDSAEGPDHHNVDDDDHHHHHHWYASPRAASKSLSRRGGGQRSGGGAMYGVKGTTNTSRQMEHYGWRLDKQGRDGPPRPEEW